MVAHRTTIDPRLTVSSPQSKMNFPPTLLRSIELWDKNDVQKWIDFAIDEYSLSNVKRNEFQMNGKALLLLSEASFQQRAGRSGDVLYKALQQHNSMIKSLNSQAFSSHFWNHLTSPSMIDHHHRSHLNVPLVLPAPTPLSMPPSYSTVRHPSAFHFLLNHSSEREFHPSPIVHRTDQSMLLPMPESIEMPRSHRRKSDDQTRSSISPNDQTRQIRFYNDRVDFRGDILYKPARAKNCRILWEFLYILLEDRQYESIIQWENRTERVFRIIQADKLAALWGLQKNRLSMTYEKLSRGMRYYYANNIISKEQSKRLLYRFMRSPEEIRNSMRRQTTTGATSMLQRLLSQNRSLSNSPRDEQLDQRSKIPQEYLQFLTDYSPSFCKSDRSSSSSPESFDSDAEKQRWSPTNSSSKRKQSTPMSLAARFSSSSFLIDSSEGKDVA